MPSQFDAYKVKDLVNQYKANPDMFSDDQLDQLEQLAEENEIPFKRQQSDFSLMRGLQQASAGFIEGFTTFDLIPKEPRNTGEAIFRQLGHLAGFAPSILKAPVVGVAKAIALGTGKKTSEVLKGKVASSVMKAIDFVGPKSIPMIVSHKTQRVFNKGIEKTGMDALEFMKRGATTRAIAEEAVGLAGASAVSSVWKGPDAIVDSFIGGAIAGGAFGGIGNFANISRYHKGTPAQVEKANKILRTGLGSMVTGLPATLRGEPTEMQIYEYLLGGFFGYNTRPAKEQYASKWLMDDARFTNRDGSAEILDPRSAKDWSKVNKEAQDYIMYEHPMPKDSEAFKNSGEYGGTTGQALGWLEYHLPETNWVAKAKKALGENATEKQLRDWYGGEASHLYKSVRYMEDIVNKAVKEASDKNDDQSNDYNDPVDIIETGTTVKEVAKKLYNKKSIVDTAVVDSETKLAEKIQKARIEHSKDGTPHVERFIADVKKSTNLSKGQERELRAFFNKDAQPSNEVWYLKISQQGKERHFSIHSGKDMMIGTGDKQVAIGEKYYEMPINKLSGGGFQLLTHFENKGLPNKILRSFVNSKEGEVQFALDSEAEQMLHQELYAKGKYIFSGVKDKNQLMVAPLIREINGNAISKDMVFDSIASGNEVIRNQLDFAFEHSKQKSTLPDGMHEEMYVSNILHHASMSGIIDASGNVNGLSRLLAGKHTTSVSDFNKRMQLLGNKMIPLDPESFIQSHPSGELNTIYVNDSDLLNHKSMNGESNIDGGQLFRESFTKNMMKAVGLPDAWHFKPVVVGRGEQGMYATKSNGQVASPAWRKFMQDNNIDRVVFGSSFKIQGEHNMTPMKYENGQYSSENPTIYKVPIKDMQVSLGTFENMHKAVKGAEIPLQMFNQYDWENPTFANEFYSMVKKSHEGTDAGKGIVSDVESGKVTASNFLNAMSTSKVDIRELPLDFVLKHLFHGTGNKKIGAVLFDKINKLDVDGELEINSFEGGDIDYSSYHEVSERIKMANEGNYFTRLSLFKKEQLNSINKFVKSRWSNPMISEGGKSWLKSYTPDMVSMMEVDPKWKTKSVKEGHIYLDNAFRKMSVVLLDKKLTLGELWDFHTGAQPLPKGITKKAVSEALDLVVIRTPADSPSGTRVLRLGGWTNQEGAGSITHAKDDFYLGGADKDSDSIKLFQGFSKGLKDAINIHKNDKESYRIKEKFNTKTGKLETIDPENPEYINEVEKMYMDESLNPADKFYISGKTKEPVTDIDRIIPKMLMFSPSMRLDVAKRAKKGLDSLGYTLSAKTWLSHMMDYVQHRGPNKATGEYFTAQTPWGEISIRVREKPVHGKSRMDFFRDLGAIGVNKGADASSDPTVKDHAGARDMFFNEILKVELNGSPVKTYEGFRRLVHSNNELKAVSRSIDAVKKNNSFRRIDNEFFDSEFDKGNIKKVGKTWVVTDEVFQKINPHEGERFIMTSKDEHGLAYVDFDPNVEKGKRSFRAEFVPNKPELIDLEADLRFVQVQFSGRGTGKSNSYINRASQNMADLLGTEPSKSYTQRLANAYSMLYKYIGADYGGIKAGLKSLNPKLIKQIEDNLGVLLEDIVLWENQSIQKKLGTQRNVSLDMFGKIMSQFAGIELLNKQYVDLVKRLNKTGTGYSVKELTKTLYKKTNELKRLARDKDSTQAEVEDLMNEHINWIREKLPADIPPDRFIQYYQTMALTPMTGVKNKRKYFSKKDKKWIETDSPVIDHIKKIHGSKFIPQRIRKEYYQNLEHFISKMEDRFEKTEIEREADSSAGKLGTEFRIKQSSLKNNLENIKEEPFKTEKIIDKVIENEGVAPKSVKIEPPIISSTEGVDVMRTSKFGNPFVVPRVYDKASKKALDWYSKQGFVRVGSREEAIQSFEDWVTGKAHKNFLQDRRQAIVDALESGELQGKKLKYFKPDAKDSHAVRLAKLVVEMGPKPIETEVIGDVKEQATDFATSPIELLALNNRDVKALNQHRTHINEHPVIRDNYAGWFGWFTKEFSNQRPRSLNTINMRDIHAMNKYFERVTDVNDLEFKMKYFMWDPRYVDQHLVLRNVANAFKKYTFNDPVTGDVVEVMKIMSPTGAISEFSKNVKDKGVDVDTNFLREANKKMFEFIGNLSDKDATMREFIDWRESGKETTPSKEILELDRLTTQFFTKMGNDYIYVKDRKGVRHSNDLGEWEMDSNFNTWFKKTKGILNDYIRFDKDGMFDFKKFRDATFDDKLPKSVQKAVGIDGVLRYKYEMKMETILKNKNGGKKATREQRIDYRQAEQSKYKGIGFFNPETYIPHGNFGKTEASRREFMESIKAIGEEKFIEMEAQIKEAYPKMGVKERVEIAQKAKDRWIRWMHDKANFSQEFMTVKDIADLSEINDAVLNKKLEKLGFNTKIGPLEGREANLQGYDKTSVVFSDYIDKVVKGYYKTLSAIHGDYQIQQFKKSMAKTYKPSEAEIKHFKELYEGGSKRRRRREGEPEDKVNKVQLGGRKPRYKNYVDVWADYMKLHLQTVLGHQTYFPEQIMYEVERGIDPLYIKDKRNLFYLSSDQNMLKMYEKLWQSKKFKKAPFIKRIMEDAPFDAEARKEYFSRKLHEFGRMEAQYELMTLLANTGTWATNIVSGNTMTLASAGIRNFVNVFNKKKVFDRLLSVNGKPVLKTLDGKDVVDRKTLTKYMEERGIIDNFIQNEFETNPNLTNSLKKAGINLKNFQRDLTIAMKGEKGKREESIGEVVSRYGVKDIMLKYGSFFMRHSEQVNRVNSYMAHAMQAIEKFGPDGRDLSIKDDWVHDMAMKGIENTQFLYQNSYRPMFMRTATGKVLSRFKLFAWNSIRTRREFYRQAEVYGFKRDTVEFNRAKDLFLTDMFMMALGGAFMFSIFDTSLAPPYDWIQALADWMYGDKRERDMAFFGSKLGPANLLKPPIARIPQAMGEILSGDMEKFAGYTAYTLFPFGRMARQITQLADDRVGHGLERAPEILLRIPYNQMKSRLDRAKRRGEQQEEIDSLL